MKAATKTESPTQTKIQETETEIKATETKITEQRTAITEFQEAITLLQTDAKYVPQPGQLLPFDQLSQLLAQQQTDAERLAKLDTAQQALQQCRAALQADEQALTDLRDYLAELQLEEEWQLKYAAIAPQYKTAFPLQSPAEERETQIQELQSAMIESREILEQAYAWIDAPSNQKPRYFVAAPWDKPFSVVESIPKRIAELETQLAELVESPITESPKYEQQFRSFVKARVLLENPLNKLIKAQTEYQAALDEFLDVFATVSNTINLDLYDAGLQKVFSIDENNVIYHK